MGFVWFIVGCLAGILGLMFLTVKMGVAPRDFHNFRNQAFERGYLVQCLGKEGYHWECDK